MNWYIPNIDPFIIYTYNELTRWILANPTFIFLVTTILGWAKIQAMKSKNVVDDKIITWLIQLFSFDWLLKLKGRNNESENT